MIYFAGYCLGYLLPPPTPVIRAITAVTIPITAVTASITVAVVITAVAVAVVTTAVAVAAPGVALAGVTRVGAVAVGVTNSGREAETEFF